MGNYQIFISYKRDIRDKDGYFDIRKKEGSELARAIYDWFVYRGYFTFLDETEMRLGDRWPNQIENAVNQSDIFLLILTDNTVYSEEVINEVKLALKGDNKKCILLSQRPELLERQGKVPDAEWQQLSRWQGLSYHELIDEKGSVDSKNCKTLCERLEQTIVGIGIYGNRYAINLLEKLSEEELSIPENEVRIINVIEGDNLSLKYYIVQREFEREDGPPVSLWGIIDGLSQVIIPFEYVEISNFENGLARAKNSRGWGYVNTNNEVVIPFGSVDEIDSHGGSKVYRQGKVGYFNEHNQETLLVEFEDFERDDGFFYAKKNGFWGIIDEHDVKGGEIIPFEYDEIGRFVNDYVRVKKGNSVMILDRICGRRFLTYDDIIIMGKELFVVKKDDLWGLVDRNNRALIPFEYDEIRYAHSHYLVRKDNLWGLVDDKNRIQIPLEYEDIEPIFSHNLFKVKQKGHWQLVDSRKSLLVTDSFEEISQKLLMSTDGEVSAIIAMKNRKWGSIEIETDKLIAPFDFDEIFPNCVGASFDSIMNSEDMMTYYLKVRQGDKWGLCSGGTLVVPCIYDDIDIWSIRGRPLFLSQRNDRGYFDFSPQLDYDVLVKVQQGTKMGVLGLMSRQLLIPCDYNSIEISGSSFNFKVEWTYPSESTFIVKGSINDRGDKEWVIIDDYSLNQNCFIADGYNVIRNVSDNDGPGEKWGIIRDGAIVIPLVFEKIAGVTCDGIAVACKDGKWGAVRTHYGEDVYDEDEGFVGEEWDENNLEQIVPFEYDDGYVLSERILCFGINHYEDDYDNMHLLGICWRVIHTDGSLVLERECHRITRSYNDDYVGVDWGQVNLNNGKFYPFSVFDYNNAGEFAVTTVFDSNIWKTRYGLVDKDGVEIFPPIFDYICNCPTDEGYFYVRLNGKWQFRDKNNEEITPWREGRLDLSTIA